VVPAHKCATQPKLHRDSQLGYYEKKIVLIEDIVEILAR
jgi:hypothetical protein